MTAAVVTASGAFHDQPVTAAAGLFLSLGKHPFRQTWLLDAQGHEPFLYYSGITQSITKVRLKGYTQISRGRPWSISVQSW
ncbi:hypothetical protein ACJX0J_007068, partial [Zea mays]